DKPYARGSTLDQHRRENARRKVGERRSQRRRERTMKPIAELEVAAGDGRPNERKRQPERDVRADRDLVCHAERRGADADRELALSQRVGGEVDPLASYNVVSAGFRRCERQAQHQDQSDRTHAALPSLPQFQALSRPRRFKVPSSRSPNRTVPRVPTSSESRSTSVSTMS